MDRILEKRPWVFYLLFPVLVVVAFTMHMGARVFERIYKRESGSNSVG